MRVCAVRDILLWRGNNFDANFFYHSKMDMDNSFYLKIGKKQILFVPKLNGRAAREAFGGKVIAYEKPMEEIAQLVKGKELALDYSSLPAKIYEKLRKVCKTKDVSEELLKMRARKKPAELEKIKKAVSLTKKIFSEIEISEFKNEKELADWLVIRTFEKGLKPAFEPIVGSGMNSAFPHYHQAKSKIKNFVLIDYGVRYENYCSDVSRVLFPNKSKKEKKVFDAYEKVQNIFYEIIDSFADFETGKDIAVFSEKLFVKYALPKPIHSIGHGLGLDIHEHPRLNKKYNDGLKGTVMAIEPAAYFKNFGVRFEETVYFDGKKARAL